MSRMQWQILSAKRWSFAGSTNYKTIQNPWLHSYEKKMKITCIALDLDKTTLDSNGALSSANRQAIEYAIQKGVHVVVASGRALDSLPEEVCRIPGIHYAIT